jgi:hypothetical protein
MPGAGQWLLFALLCFATLTAWVQELWAVCVFYAGVFVLAASRAGAIPAAHWLVFAALPAVGLVQLALGITVVPAYTVEAAVRWAALAAVFAVSRQVCTSTEARHRFLTASSGFGIALAVLCLLQMNTADGRFLWIFETRPNPGIFGSFGSYNNWAHFVELMLPITLWKIAKQPRLAGLYTVATGLFAASVVASGSRAGTFSTILILIVTLAVLSFHHPLIRRRFVTTLAMAPVAAAAFTVLVGWDLVIKRFQQPDLYNERRDFLYSSIELVKDRPVLGWGLGTWTSVYPHRARIDSATFVNFAHNDWAEYSVEGGLVFLAALAVPFLRAAPWMLRHPWSLGILAVLLHAWVDYPFPRPGVSGWLFAILGTLYAARDSEGPHPLH